MSALKLHAMLKEKHLDMKFTFFTGHGSEDNFKPVNIEALIDKMQEGSPGPGACL